MRCLCFAVIRQNPPISESRFNNVAAVDQNACSQQDMSLAQGESVQGQVIASNVLGVSLPAGASSAFSKGGLGAESYAARYGFQTNTKICIYTPAPSEVRYS